MAYKASGFTCWCLFDVVAPAQFDTVERRRGELGGKLRDYQAVGRKSAGSGHLRRFVFKGDAVDL
jgi:hypothetical protein